MTRLALTLERPQSFWLVSTLRCQLACLFPSFRVPARSSSSPWPPVRTNPPLLTSMDMGEVSVDAASPTDTGWSDLGGAVDMGPGTRAPVISG